MVRQSLFSDRCCIYHTSRLTQLLVLCCLDLHCFFSNLQVWQSLFSVRSLVVPMHEDVDAWLKFASLCRKSGRPRQVCATRSLCTLRLCIRTDTCYAMIDGC
jgi:hypothetical protein